MLPLFLVLVAVTEADINIDINITGEEEAALRGSESSKGRNTTSTVVNNSENNLREVAEDCGEKKVCFVNNLFSRSYFYFCQGWTRKAVGVWGAERQCDPWEWDPGVERGEPQEH